MELKCGECGFAEKCDTPICTNPYSIHFEEEISEDDYCIRGELAEDTGEFDTYNCDICGVELSSEDYHKNNGFCGECARDICEV